MANWYVIYTRPGWEKKISEKLSKRKIENYHPITKDYRFLNDLNKVIYIPLFPNIIFVRLNDIDIPLIKSFEGVINLIYWIEKPAIIRDIEIEMIKRFINEHSSVYLEKAYVSPTEIVRIVNGPLMEEDGNIIAVSINKTKLILPSLGYSIIADVTEEKVDIVNMGNRKQRISKF